GFCAVIRPGFSPIVNAPNDGSPTADTRTPRGSGSHPPPIDRDDAGCPRSRQNGRHQGRPNALLAPIGRNIKLLEPGYRTNMFHAQNRGDMSDTNDTALYSCQLNETTFVVSDDSLQQSRQGLGRRLNPMLTQLLHQKAGTLSTILGLSGENRKRWHFTAALAAQTLPLLASPSRLPICSTGCPLNCCARPGSGRRHLTCRAIGPAFVRARSSATTVRF
ncbi:MAG: hypothetical protein QOJ40_2659, partial [Verrucomicrobiota bacterium]